MRSLIARDPSDPAPSLWAYRAQRLWLTPLFRRTLRLSAPVLCIALGLAVAAKNGAPGHVFVAVAADLWTQFKSRPEFAVSILAVEGASEALAGQIETALTPTLPVSTFDLDVSRLEIRLAALGAVADARFALRPGGTLAVTVEERPAALLWRGPGGLSLLDGEGVVLGEIERRSERPDLPLVVGEGAADDAAGAMEVIEAAGPVAPRIRGLVRVGLRRWDVVLDRGQRLMLPADGAGEAMRRIAAMDGAEDLLGRDVAHVDMRLPHRPTVRLTAAGREARAEMRRSARGGTGNG